MRSTKSRETILNGNLLLAGTESFPSLSNNFLDGATVSRFRYGTIWPCNSEFAAEKLFGSMWWPMCFRFLLLAFAFAWCISH